MRCFWVGFLGVYGGVWGVWGWDLEWGWVGGVSCKDGLVGFSCKDGLVGLLLMW